MAFWAAAAPLGVTFGGKSAGRGELARPAHGRLEVDHADQPPWTGLDEQVLAHDPGRRPDGPLATACQETRRARAGAEPGAARPAARRPARPRRGG
jgi:hypothetical protein